MKKLGIVLLFGLQGCYYTKPLMIAPMALGPKEHPHAIVSGKSEAIYLLGISTGGDNTFEAALNNARDKGNVQNSTLANVFVDRHYSCFPACWIPIVMTVETTVTGTLITYDADK